MPSRVEDVFAMLVDTITFRPGGPPESEVGGIIEDLRRTMTGKTKNLLRGLLPREEAVQRILGL